MKGHREKQRSKKEREMDRERKGKGQDGGRSWNQGSGEREGLERQTWTGD